ncbi:MAG TPA: flagellar biosynthesis protein FlhB, partial [Clostridiales bacterium UBA8153]|nr:flagellar biosynthesis protein FlhB [Clostridiales bacterium UBA8153]
MQLQLFSQEKREAPTQRKRQEARRKGQVFQSAELSAAVGLLAVYYAVRLTAPRVAELARSLLVEHWQELRPVDTVDAAQALYLTAVRWAGAMAWPLAAAAVGASLVVGTAQTGLGFNGGLLAPKLERLNPLAGLQKLFSRRTLVEGAKAVLKVTLVGAVVWTALERRAGVWPTLGLMHPLPAVGLVAEAVHGVAVPAGLVLLGLGAIDYAYQWWEHEKNLRMTRQELKDELKDTEGRPEVKAAQRTRQRLLARRRMMAAVAKSDVVVTNPIHYAIALKYNLAVAPAPEVVAKGRDLMAARIVAEARKHRVAIVPNPSLAQALYRSVDIGDYIPPQLYQAVA